MNKNEENLMQSEKIRQETVRSLGDLGHTVGCVIRFTLMFNGFMMRKRSYGGGEKLTLVELMLLLTIPGLIKGRLYRWQGILLLAIYAAFCAFQFLL